MPKIIAVAGGSCSGKTSLAQQLAATLGSQRCNLMYQDSYYRGTADITNYDVPEAIEFELLAQHLEQLKQGQSVAMPVYDFTTHRRKPERESVQPKPVIIVDGILILHAPELANSFDLKVFVECEESIRKQRRLIRDCQERGRNRAEVIAQFDNQVAPLHNQYVEPSKACADILYRNDGDRDVASLLCHRLMNFCRQENRPL